MSQSEPTLFVVDDDAAVLDAMSEVAQTIDMNVETFRSAQEFLDAYDPHQPGCLVVDVRMPNMSGLELQSVLIERGIELPVVVISGHAEVPLAVSAVKAGAMDFLEKPVKPQELLDLIHVAFEQDARNRQQQNLVSDVKDRYETLTPREREVMQLLITGLLGKQIAMELGISSRTVEKFRASIMKKMKVDSVAELVLLSVNMGLVPQAGSLAPSSISAGSAPSSLSRRAK